MPIIVTNPFVQNEAVVAHAAIDELASKAAAGAELFASYYYVGGLSASGSFPIFGAPFALQVKQVSVIFWAMSNLATSDVDYWRLAVRRSQGITTNEMVSKSTQTTGGEAITTKVDWNFDTVTFSPTYSLIAKGDTVDLAMYKTGVPAALTGILCTVRYEPL